MSRTVITKIHRLSPRCMKTCLLIHSPKPVKVIVTTHAATKPRCWQGERQVLIVCILFYRGIHTVSIACVGKPHCSHGGHCKNKKNPGPNSIDQDYQADCVLNLTIIKYFCGCHPTDVVYCSLMKMNALYREAPSFTALGTACHCIQFSDTAFLITITSDYR